MKLRKLYRTGLIMGMCLVLSAAAMAQSRSISGLITDQNGQPLLHATVAVQHSSISTTTDSAGTFKLNVPEAARYLIISYVGAQTKEVPINNRSHISESLTLVANSLDEIVVIGYGTVKKGDLTGAVSSIKNSDMAATTISSFQQGLKGRVSGVDVVQGDATPGGGTYIQIRGISTMLGSTEPLYVIDGVPVSVATTGGTTSAAGFSNTNPLATIASSDIESIEVLKDASATAIYGSQGANGVIMITTRKGRKGQGVIGLNVTQSVSVLAKKIEVLNARQYAEYKNEAYANNAPYNPTSNWDYPIDNTDPKKLSPQQLEQLVGKGIDWQDLIYRPASVSDYQLSFSGGSDNGSYAIMANYLNQDGILKNTGFTRGGLRMNMDHQVNKTIKVLGSVAFTRSKNRLVKTSTNDGSAKAGGVVRKALTYSPIPPILRDIDGNVIGISENNPDNFDTEDPAYQNNWGATPLRFLEEAKVNQTLSNLTGNLETQINLYKNLLLKLRLGGVYYEQLNDNYFPRTLNEGMSVDGLAQMGSKNYANLISENLLSYKFKINNRHQFDLLGGLTYSYSSNRFRNSEASGFANDDIGFWGMGSAVLTQPTPVGAEVWKMMSFFGRVNYTLNNKYLFTYTYRTDGSSKFAANRKWAAFQSGAFAWKVNNEEFLKNIDWLSNLKLRVSYGESGNQGLSPYQSLSTMSANTAVIGNTLVNSFSETAQQNPDLKWETTSQINLGLDFGLFRERIFGSVNFYDKVTRDLLQRITLPPTTGFSSKTVNSGKIRNRGWELELGGKPLRKKDFDWTINGNISRNRNTILDLGGVQQQFAPSLGGAYGLNVQPFIQKVGYPIGAIYGYVLEGIFQNQQEVDNYVDQNGAKIKNGSFPVGIGLYRFKDLDGNGAIDANDQTIIGNTNPDFMWGINNTFVFRAFDLGVFVTGVKGGNIINTNIIMPQKLNAEGNIPVWLYESAWRGEGTSTTQRQIKGGNEEPKRFMSLYLDELTYTRISNIQLGYTFNVKKISAVKSLRVSANAINPFTFSRYHGYDPEVSANSSPLSRGVDLGSYPHARTFSVSINANF